MYFPQFNFSVEIDEGQHINAIEQDKIRDQDYIFATKELKQHPKGWMPRRIEVERTNNRREIAIEEINSEIDKVVIYIRKLKKESNNFISWDLSKEFDYKDKDYFDVEDQIVFKTIKDGINYFRTPDKEYHGYQRAGAPTMDKLKLLWFPKLYPNKDWNNSLSDDENLIKTIPEKSTNLKIENYLQNILEKGVRKRIVFARVKGSLGFVLYRFKGYYELDEKMSNENGYCCWIRKTTKVKVPSGDPIF